jgi:hypothetical protein
MIASAKANPPTLWPPNHKMVPVEVIVGVSDACDGAASCRIVAVASSEPESLGNGDPAPDWAITGDLTLTLRAERAGRGAGRTYAITVECSDLAGNVSQTTVEVLVPHDRR